MRRARSSAFVLLGAVFAIAAACTESTAPLGKGNDTVVDVDSSTTPPEQGGDDGSTDDSPFAPVDSGYKRPPDGYSPYTFCSSCSCPSGDYCFGGGTNFETFNGDCHEDGGLDGGLAIGCQPFPPACANEPSCECLIQALAPIMPCYPVCSITSMIVYCPNP